ncbi:hypothetical protein SORBI_3001G240700 [Sorghum bicolor]|uniref:Uncharacterized protein n=1 Tax=Sorghum bicolor TaxID=4558 RepID=A0A1B6QKM8_SORBI|nr:hypothetical protein SORBI_3001G240700 [Sorghum bicolor]
MSLAPSACDSTTALDSPPGLPSMAPPPLVVHHGGARRRHLLLPAWRKTVATPGPEDLRCYFLSSRSAVLSTPNISTPSQLGYFLYQE